MEKNKFIDQMKEIPENLDGQVVVNKSDFDALIVFADYKGATGDFFAQNRKIHVKDGLITNIEFTGGIE